MGQLKQQALSGVKWQTTSTVYSSVVKILQVAVLARLLHKADYGPMGIAELVNSFCSIYVDMCLSSSATPNIDLMKRELSSFYCINCLAGTVLIVVVSFS